MTGSLSPRKAVCLVGPTGSGKTGAALHLARLLAQFTTPVTVINADSRQVYHDFPVITAQPTVDEQTVCPHRLYGYLPTQAKISAGQWADKARCELAAANLAGALPVLVGGTGLYLKALLDGMVDIPAPDPELSARLMRECVILGSAELYDRLAAHDSEYASRIHPNDKQRIVRALEVWESTGKTFTWWHTQTPHQGDWDVLRLGIGLPLPELTPFLGQRIQQMLDAGALTEAHAAMQQCPDLSAPGWSGIGCREIGAYVHGKLSLDECVELWERNTRAYAKRQWTWFRADARIRWLRPEQTDELEQTAQEFLGL